MSGVRDEIVAFLRARWDDDERVARRVLRYSRDSYAHCPYESWVADRKVNNRVPPYHDYWQVRTDRPATMSHEVARFDLDLGGITAAHVARFASPRRVLADLRGRREMLDDILAVPGFRGTPMLRCLAVPYADHPDYRQEWTG